MNDLPQALAINRSFTFGDTTLAIPFIRLKSDAVARNRPEIAKGGRHENAAIATGPAGATAAVPLKDLLAPLLTGARAVDIRRTASRLRDEAERLEQLARDLERAEAERRARADRHRRRQAALEDLRAAWRRDPGGAAVAAEAAAAAARHDLDADALLSMFGRDRRRMTRAERECRNMEIMRLVARGYSSATIAELAGVSTATVDRVVARAKRQLSRAPLTALAARIRPLPPP